MARIAGTSRLRQAAASPELRPADVFKALGDPVRWSIVSQAAEAGELAASTLEDTLEVSKPTISYHTKILVQAGLLAVRKEGRNFYYTLRDDVLHALIDDMRALTSGPGDGAGQDPGAAASAGHESDGTLPTW
ncbi:ArsR/SmtB family transcription factor [Streptomyces prunicolor]|uniref:Metalloregulator ArsR/SmtB family transcription factor n=1 Tax=Streptomyces prunicolor TaxID=67348 RepID=A0ABU4FBT8_9ACTN|nr:metalloregulator ArsR/SmtB family transcription factor [Streptomyces prunicolor]MDV7218066.1 metalloregulator ArsR/SmtB family transcription factor [Streptomyces prunicolor]